MDQIAAPETRRRSRSKTPFVLRSQCDKENCTEADHIHGPVKKIPAVQTIVEESEQSPVVAVPPTSSTSSSSGRTSTRTTRAIDKVSDQVSSISTVAATKITEVTVLTSSSSSSQSQQTTSTATSIRAVAANKFGAKLSAGATATGATITSIPTAAVEGQVKVTKSKNSTRSTKESSQNEINEDFEQNSKLRTSTPILNKTTRKTHVTSPIANNGDLSDHAPYKEYKEAGEYWNKYPKTDYTYSKLSPHRRELGNGAVAMPNMSRKSLEHHHERVDIMAMNNPEKESYIRARYQSTNYPQVPKFQQRDVYYDSQDEVDLSEFETRRYAHSYSTKRQQQTNIIRRLLTTITETIYSSWYRLFSVFKKSEVNRYYTRIEEEKGLAARVMSTISSAISTVFLYFYIFISSILFLDSWLLKASNTENGNNKKRFLLFLLVILPLLLLAGAYHYFDKPLPLPVSLDNVFDPIVYLDNAKLYALNQFEAIGEVSNNVWTNVKNYSQLSIDEMQNIWNENFAG